MFDGFSLIPLVFDEISAAEVIAAVMELAEQHERPAFNVKTRWLELRRRQ